MPSLAVASRYLDRKLAAQNGETVTYRRGGAFVVLTDAVVGNTEFVQETPEGQVVASSRSRDYLVPVASLVLEGQPALPEAGDTIEQSINGVVKQYELVSTGTEPPFRYTDPSETHYRIHTQLIGTV